MFSSSPYYQKSQPEQKRFRFPRRISAEAIALILTVLLGVVAAVQCLNSAPAEHSPDPAKKNPGIKITETSSHGCNTTN